MTWTGGGQPNDTGIFRITSSSSSNPIEFQVVNVQRRGLSAVHHVRIPKELQATVEEILKPGVKVDMQVDWERRWDHVSTCDSRSVPLSIPESDFDSHLFR
jgi:Ser-tRNA(Ala) deacylase AlaX